MVPRLNERMDRNSGSVMAYVTVRMAQLLRVPTAAKIITSMESSGVMELRSSQDGKQRSPCQIKNRSAHGPSNCLSELWSAL